MDKDKTEFRKTFSKEPPVYTKYFFYLLLSKRIRYLAIFSSSLNDRLSKKKLLQTNSEWLTALKENLSNCEIKMGVDGSTTKFTNLNRNKKN